MAQVLDGKAIANTLKAELTERVRALQARGITPGLAVVMVGSDEASAVYLSRKKKTGEGIGLRVDTHLLPAESTTGQVIDLIKKLNADPAIHGILVEQPLPKGLDKDAIIDSIDPQKDVDGSSLANLGNLFLGRPGFVPCTPQSVMTILERYNIPLAGKHAVVVGRSTVVGKPLSMLLLAQNATVTICHSKTRDLPAITKQADILVAAVGVPKMITADMVREGAIVLDVGINVVDGKTVGDVDYEAVAPKAAAITPVPGGVGSVTTMIVLQHVVESAERR